MPRGAKFKFKDRTHQVQFECDVNRNSANQLCYKCTARIGPRGSRRQCSRGTCLYSPYCWQHSRFKLHLRIMTSLYLNEFGINALGLYAYDKKKADLVEPVFHRGDVLRARNTGRHVNGLYGGQRLSQEELDERYDYEDEECDVQVDPTAPYANKVESGIYDAACQRGIASLCNSVRRERKFRKRMPRRKGREVNYRNNARVNKDGNLIFLKDVDHGEEILINYGNAYWEGETFQCGDLEKSSGSHVTTGLKVSGDRSLGIPEYRS